MQIYGFATSSTPASKSLQRALKSRGSEFRLYGEGQTWKGWVTKINGVIEITKSVPNEELIVIIDAYDILPNTHFTEDELIRRFYLINPDASRVVVGAESACFLNCYKPARAITREYVTNRKYHPNGGFVMGKAGLVHRLYKRILEYEWDFDDQYGLGWSIADRGCPVKIVLDFQSLLVNNLSVSKGKYLSADKTGAQRALPVVTAEGSTPMFWHFPRVNADGYARYNHVLKYFGDKLEAPRFARASHFRAYVNNPVYLQILLPLLACALLIPFIAYFVRKRNNCSRSYDALKLNTSGVSVD